MIRLDRLVFSLFLIFAILALINPSPSLAQKPLCKGKEWIETRLYLGRDIKGVGEVTDNALGNFLKTIVVPKFPDGFTLLNGTGYWRGDDEDQTETENSLVLIVVHPQSKMADDALAIISQSYIKQFYQSSVLRTDRFVCVTF